MQDTTKFVAACCRWPQTEAAQSAVSQAASQITDWDELQQVADRHRVIPLVHLAIKDLTTVPERIRAWAKQGAHATAMRAMKMTHDCIAIDTAFKAAGVEPLHFKGPALGQIAYGSVALKYSVDLDIFVEAADVGAAVAVLEEKGYRWVHHDQPITPRQISAIVHNFKDLSFMAPTGTYVELHWRFALNKTLLARLENDLRRESVTVAGNAQLDTFNATQMLAYLSVHGAMHHWRRLKWLADVAAFLEQLPPVERDRIIAELSQGPERDAVAQALCLCDTLFGTQYAPPMSRRAKALYDHALICIDTPQIPPRSVRGDLSFLRDVLVMRHVYPTSWAALWSLNTYMFCLNDVLEWPLPRHLNGLYPAIRLPSLLLRRIRG